MTSVRDVVVIGGGPSGAMASRLLAMWGLDVLLVDRPSPRPALAESLPPSCRGLLEVAGVSGQVDAAGFIQATGNTVWWAGASRRVEHFPGGRTGWQVERERFDALLRDAALACGAEVWRPALAVDVVAAADGDGAKVVVERGTQRTDVRARWVLDCSGRAGLVGRRGRVSSGRAWRTMALAALGERAGGWDLPDESHTLVESATWGWGWSVPVDASHRYFTVMFNPAESSLSQSVLPAEFERRLGDLPMLGALASRCSRLGVPFACDASTYSSTEVVHGRVLVVGDAASFLDPLSSFGVKKAMASAWLAAVAVRSALDTPQVTEAALQLFSGREGEYVRAAAGPLGDLSREAASGSEGFWGNRAALEGDERQADLVAALRDDPQVRAAFQELRTRDPAVLRLGLLQVVPAPMVRNDRVVIEDHLLLPGVSGPTRFLRNVDLVRLADLAGEGRNVGDVCASYQARIGDLPLPDLIGAISVLVAKGVLVFLDTGTRRP